MNANINLRDGIPFDLFLVCLAKIINHSKLPHFTAPQKQLVAVRTDYDSAHGSVRCRSVPTTHSPGPNLDDGFPGPKWNSECPFGSN